MSEPRDAETDARRAKPGVSCSFCSKRQPEVLAMFAGPSGVYICNECIGLFAQEVAKRQDGEDDR